MGQVNKINSTFSRNKLDGLRKNATTYNSKNTKNNKGKVEKINIEEQQKKEEQRKIEQATNQTKNIFERMNSDLISMLESIGANVDAGLKKTNATIGKNPSVIEQIRAKTNKEAFKVKHVVEDNHAIMTHAEELVDNVRVSGTYVVGKIYQLFDKDMTDEDVESVVNGVREEVDEDDYLEDKIYNISEGLVNLKDGVIDTGKSIGSNVKKLATGEITFKQAAKSVGATASNLGVSVFEGIGKWGENVVDGVKVTGGLIYNGVATNLGMKSKDSYYDSMEKIEEDVAIDGIGGLFDMFYDETKAGNWVKDNSVSYETVRSLGTGAGQMLMNIGMAYVAGQAAGTSMFEPANGKTVIIPNATVSKATLAGTTGLTGIGQGAEDAWSNGGTLEEGLLTGFTTGAWNTFQYMLGAKISGLSPFESKAANILTRISLDALDGGAEGFVQPAIQMIYKDGYYDKTGNYIKFTEDSGLSTLMNNYVHIFEENGGMKNVRMNAAMGAAGSAFGEIMDLRRKMGFENSQKSVEKIKNDNNISTESKLKNALSYAKEKLADNSGKASLGLFDIGSGIRNRKIDNVFKTLVDKYGLENAIDRLDAYVGLSQGGSRYGDITLITKQNNARQNLMNISIDDVYERLNYFKSNYDNYLPKTQNSQFGKYNSYNDVVSVLSDPICNYETLDKLYRNLVNGNDSYRTITHLNNPNNLIKQLPGEATRNYFWNYIFNSDSTIINQALGLGYEITPADTAINNSFLHIQSKGLDVDKVTERLYLNVDYESAYKIIPQFIEECKKNGLEYYTKTSQYDGILKNPNMFMRDESVVFYSDRENLHKYINILENIINNDPSIVCYAPPALTSPIDGIIGYGSEPKTSQRMSYNRLRANIIKEAYDNVVADYNYYIPYDSEGYKTFLDNFYTKIKMISGYRGVSPENFIFNLE